MAQETAQERTEQATPKRRAEARERGQVPRSRELTTMAVLIAAAGGLLLAGGGAVAGIVGMMRGVLRLERRDLMDAEKIPAVLGQAIFDALAAIAPLLLVITVAALFAPLALSGWTFSAKAIAFRWEKLDPIKGLARVFSARGLVELLKALAKFALVFAVALVLLWSSVGRLLALGVEPLLPAIADAGRTLGWSFLILSCAMVVVAAVDVPFQLWDHARQLRMTRQEIKDEYKETDGSPEVKRRVREVQREMARRRMMQEVPKADVVVTNPTHYAVALKYDHRKMAAPVVVAKGRDLIALQIRRVAIEHNVPLLSAPPLSRALYYSTELRQQIPEGLFLAVAQVLAYAYRLRRRPYRRYQEPQPMGDLPIPDDLRRD